MNKDNFGDLPKNMYGDLISTDMVNLAITAREKRIDTWKQVEVSSDICNVKVKYLRVLPNKEIDDLLYVNDNKDD